MNDAYLSAMAALAGSSIGTLGGIATTWLTLTGQQRAHRRAQAMSRKEQLYEDFIDEASRVFAEALTHKVDDPAKFVRLWALLSKIRLFASASVMSVAEQVMLRIITTYQTRVEDVSVFLKEKHDDLDVLRDFGVACRDDLGT